MVSTSSNEPTLRNLAEKLDKLSSDVDKLSGDVGKLSGDVGKLSSDVGKLTGDVDKLSGDVGKLTGDVDKLTGELAQTQKWQDRTWDVIKWVGGISAGLAISASIALVGIVLKFATGQ